MFGSNVSTPSSAISWAISTIATTGAPVRLAISTVSPKWSAWPWVSRIVGRVDVVGGDRGLRVAGQERVDQDPRVAVGELEAGVPEKTHFHVWISPPVVVVLIVDPRGPAEFSRQLEPDGHADEHPDPGLLGDQRAQFAHPF